MTSRTLGGCLLAAGVVWLLGWGSMFLAGHFDGRLDTPATILGVMVFGVPIAIALGVGGAVLLAQARRESAQRAEAQFEARVLDMIETRGSARLPELADELRSPPEQIKAALYDLVGKRLFTGYVNWEAQRVYSVDAARLPRDTCPNCGAKLELGGKGTVVCPYCHSEIFLPPSNT